jgi:dTDP-4-amino-4,6-dideoxygalactose transaminase
VVTRFSQDTATMNIPMLDLSRQHAAIREEVRAAIDRCIDTSSFILGKTVQQFEANLANWCGVKHALGISSGTDALLIALMALDIGPGDEVIIPPFTFFATAGVVSRVGAVPIFADIDPATFNIAPSAIEKAITHKTKAIIPVHLFGQAADMTPIMEIAARHRLHVIEDVAQAIGAKDEGRMAGSIGAIGCLSFYPTKNLGAFGDAGAVLTNDDDLAERLKVLRVHGQTDEYRHQYVGGNFRIDAMQAAVLDIKLKHLSEYEAGRRAAAKKYEQLLKGLPITLPREADGKHHVYNQYTIRSSQRDALNAHMKASGIGHRVYYPLPLHLQPCFSPLGYRRGEMPESERAADEVVSLPMYPEIPGEHLEKTAEVIRAFFNK